MAAREPIHPLIPLAVLLKIGKTDDFLIELDKITSRSDHIALDAPIPARNNQTLLHFAARSNNEKATSALLKANASANKASNSATPLYLAALYGYTKIAELLLQNGAEPDAVMPNSSTALHVAIQNKHIDVIRLLLQHDASPHVAAIAEFSPIADISPLHMAAQYGHTDIAALLLQFKADIHGTQTDGATPLLIAAEYGHIDVVALFLRSGADIHCKNNDGATPLLIASQFGHAHVAELLLQSGASPNDATPEGVTPLLVAAWNGHTDIVALLLQFDTPGIDKTNIDCARIADGITPLHVATLKGHAAITDLLLKAGAYPTPIGYTTSSVTPLRIARSQHHLHIAVSLKQRDAQLQTSSTDGARIALRSPLSTAAFYGDIDGVQQAIAHGAPLPPVRFRFHSQTGNPVDRLIDRNRFLQASGLLIRDAHQRLVLPIASIPRLFILAFGAMNWKKCRVSAAPNEAITASMVAGVFAALDQWQKSMDQALADPYAYPLADGDRKTFFALRFKKAEKEHTKKEKTLHVKCSIS